MVNLEKAYKEDAQKIRELGGLTVVMGVLHETYTTQSLENKIDKDGGSARKRLRKALKDSEEIIKYLRTQYP